MPPTKRRTSSRQSTRPSKVAKNLESVPKKSSRSSSRSTRATRNKEILYKEENSDVEEEDQVSEEDEEVSDDDEKVSQEEIPKRRTRGASKVYTEDDSNEEEVSEQEEEEQSEEDEGESKDDAFQQEQIVVVKIKADTPVKKTPSTKKAVVAAPAATAPLSAIAARKAAINAGFYKEPEDTTQEETEETEEEEEDREGIEVASITDEEEMEIREAMEHDEVLPISEVNTPTGTPRRPLNTKKYKIPPLMDPQSVSKFTASDKNYRVIKQEEDTYLVVGLKSGEDIVFMGQVLAAPLYGSISVCGAVISSGREIPTVVPEEGLLVPLYPVFSPRTHSLLRIASEPLDMPSIQSHYNPIELDENLVDAILDELKDGLDEFETILVLKELESGLQDMREAVSPFTKNLVRFTKAESSSSSNEHLAIHRLAGFHPIMEEPTPGVKSFKVEHSWQSRTDLALNSSTARQSPIVSVVCGAKDMGKSSFSRYLINRLLAKYKRVAYLETDVGQSEFTPSGLLSLHYLTNPILGPPFTHQQLEPERSFYFGSASPRNNPDYYIDCIFELVNHWRQDQDQVRDEQEQEWIPLVVNTQGWVSGVGYELLLNQIRKVGPTDIFTMRHHVFEYKNLPHTFNVDILPVQNEAFMIEKEAPNLHYLDCVLQDPNVMTMTDNFTSIQQRDMTLGSYFHQSGMGDDNYLSPVWNYHQHLIHRTPWVVDWRQTAIWVVYEEVKLNELFYALNGSLVGLVGDVTDYKKQDGPKKSLAENNDTFTPPTYFNTQDQPAPKAHRTTCYGLGIVRAIDPNRHALLLLTPLPLNTLTKVSSIIKGEIQLPLWTMLDHRLEKNTHGVANVPWKKLPYISQERNEGAGANALRVRRNLLRRSQ